jgi:GNAT superfamily N-acetyltransferase
MKNADADDALLVERHVAEWFRAQAVVPETEVHDDADVTWVVQDGSVWGNAGTLVRFTSPSAAGRLDEMLARYRAHGTGMGLWVSPAATPTHLPDLLRARRMRCRKYFPAMVRRLNEPAPTRARVAGLEIRAVENPDEFLTTPHPSIGCLTTPRRRHAFVHLRSMTAAQPRRTWSFVAWLDGTPVGASLLFLGTACAGLHGLDVIETHRGRGIGGALLDHTCAQAALRGAQTMVLLATSEGQRVYEGGGFEEVARFGYWYRSFQRLPSASEILLDVLDLARRRS